LLGTSVSVREAVALGVGVTVDLVVLAMLGAGGSCDAVGTRSLSDLFAAAGKIFVVNCAVVCEDNDTKTVGGASGFPFLVEEVIVFAEEDAGAEGLVGGRAGVAVFNIETGAAAG
jgi:hypothetical protein